MVVEVVMTQGEGGMPAPVLHYVGEPYLRDPESPCFDFELGIPDGVCESDGHYFCKECRWFDAREPPTYVARMLDNLTERRVKA